MSPNNIYRDKPMPIFCVRRSKNLSLVNEKHIAFGSSFDSLSSLIKPSESSLRETQFNETEYH